MELVRPGLTNICLKQLVFHGLRLHFIAMTIFTGIIVYLLTFWVVLFAVLPWGSQSELRKPEDGISGAPINPRVKQKFIATALISAVIWGIIFALIEIEIIDFYDMARQMSESDQTE